MERGKFRKCPSPFGRGARGEGVKLSAKSLFEQTLCLATTTNRKR